MLADSAYEDAQAIKTDKYPGKILNGFIAADNTDVYGF